MLNRQLTGEKIVAVCFVADIKMNSKSLSLSCLGALLLCTLLHSADCVAVMSVDLGTEWMKIGIVSVRILNGFK